MFKANFFALCNLFFMVVVPNLNLNKSHNATVFMSGLLLMWSYNFLAPYALVTSGFFKTLLHVCIPLIVLIMNETSSIKTEARILRVHLGKTPHLTATLAHSFLSLTKKIILDYIILQHRLYSFIEVNVCQPLIIFPFAHCS